MAPIERRRTRSNVPGEAVRLYLSTNAARAGVKAAALSHADGSLVGGSGDVDLATLAAVGPLFVSGGHLTPEAEARIDEVVKNHDVYASRLTVAGTTFVLTTLGARFPEQRRAERAFTRIFAG